MSETEVVTTEPTAAVETAAPEAGGEPSTETSKATTTPASSPDKTTARLLELARREARLVREQREIEARKSEYEQAVKLANEFKTNPYAALKQFNVPFDNLLDVHLNELNGKKAEPKDDRPEWAKRIEQRWEEEEKAKAAAAEKAKNDSYQESINAHLSDVGKLIQDANSKDPDKYVSILLDDKKAANVYLDIYRTAISELGRSLDEDEVRACIDRTEELLTEEYKPFLEKASKSKKLGFFNSTKIEPEPTKTETPKVKTLTNSLTATAPTTPNQPDPSKSAYEQRVAQVLAARKKLG